MASIETEKDIERLRKMALVLHKENDVLHQRLQRLTVELALARGEDRCQLELELQLLKERLDRQNRTMFGSSSTTNPRPNEDERAKTNEQPAARTRTGHGPRKQPELPVVERVHELDEPDKLCPQCGGDLSPMTGQFEEAEEIDVVEREFRIVRHKRQKYNCKCGGCVDTALGPPKLIPGGHFSVDFAVAVAVAKYADHLPLARQVKQMQRQGLTTTSQTLWDQLWALHSVLLPSYEALPGYVVDHSVIGADETTWPLMETGKTTTGPTPPCATNGSGASSSWC